MPNILNDNVNISPHKNQDYKHVLKENEKQLNELHDYDKKINELILNKIQEFESENRALTTKLASFQTKFKVLSKSLLDAQKDSKICEEKYKRLKVGNKNLLAILQSVNHLYRNKYGEFSDELLQQKSETVEEIDPNNNNISNKNYFVNEGLLIIRK